MIQTFIWSETTPAVASTVASSSKVQGTASYLPAGIGGPMDDSDGIMLAVDIGSPSGGTLDVFVQRSEDQGVSFRDFCHFPQQAAAGAAKSYLVGMSLGTNSPSPFSIGTGNGSLSANALVPGAYGDRFRLLFVAGAGTNASTTVKVTACAQRSWKRRAG